VRASQERLRCSLYARSSPSAKVKMGLKRFPLTYAGMQGSQLVAALINCMYVPAFDWYRASAYNHGVDSFYGVALVSTYPLEPKTGD
jgi:hypothetical protein